MNVATTRPACCRTADGRALPLSAMRIEGTVQAPCAVFELSQTYVNTETVNIEAVYSFPLPLSAVLLHLGVTLDGRVLVGRVTGRAEAEQRYEEALTGGDSAVMLEQAEPGLYTLNLGNLMAGETIDVRLRFAMPLHWDEDRLRLALPTTVAPRYGHPAESVQPHQQPHADPLVEHRYSLAVRIPAPLASAQVQSPTHRLSTSVVEGQLLVALDAVAADRDFVLVLQAPAEARSGIVFGEHEGESAAHAMFCVPSRAATAPLGVKVLIDCSGSMGGDSIALARRAACRAIGLLHAGDACSVARFGSTVVEGPMARLGRDERRDRQVLEHFADASDADLGGTEMLQALQSAFRRALPAGGEHSGHADVLLITDGETWAREPIVKAAAKAGQRVFVIGIGASPAEVVVRDIAEATGGAATFVTPNEDVEAAVDRHVQRMRGARPKRVTFEIEGRDAWQSPSRLEPLAFAGDTLHIGCGLKPARGTSARLSIEWMDGTATVIDAPDRTPAGGGGWVASDVPRIATALRLRDFERTAHDVPVSEIKAMAVKHQLVSPHTNVILVVERGESAAADLPELRQVRPMLAAGWGGTGAIPVAPASAPRLAQPLMADVSMRASADISARKLGVQSRRHPYLASGGSAKAGAAPAGPAEESMVFESRATIFSTSGSLWSPHEVIGDINGKFGLVGSEKHVVRSVLGNANSLVTLVANEKIANALRELVDLHWREEDIAIAFWLALLSSPLGAEFSRAHRRGILRAARTSQPPQALADFLAEALAGTTAWGWEWKPARAAPACTATA